MTEDEKYIRDHVSEAAMYEQLAEECTELAQATLKMARKIRGENPTPKTKQGILLNLIEEISDVDGCLCILGLEPKEDEKLYKNWRWVRRLKGEEKC